MAKHDPDYFLDLSSQAGLKSSRGAGNPGVAGASASQDIASRGSKSAEGNTSGVGSNASGGGASGGEGNTSGGGGGASGGGASGGGGDHSQVAGRPWIAIFWKCCQVYSRVYRNRQQTAYQGRCPKCGSAVKATIGQSGTSTRFFEAE